MVTTDEWRDYDEAEAYHLGDKLLDMVGEMVQNSQSLDAFTFNVLIDIHEFIHSHSTTEFTF